MLAISVNLEVAQNRVTPTTWRAQTAPNEGQIGDHGLRIHKQVIFDGNKDFVEICYDEHKGEI